MLPSTSLKQELKLFLRRVGLLRSSLSQLRCAATHGSLTAASPLTDACGSSRLAFFHLLVLPRTPTVPGPSCSVRPPAFPALKHIHVPRGVSSHCHCASLSGVQHPVARSCLTLCDPMDCSPPGSSVRGILQARMLETIVISSSRGSS